MRKGLITLLLACFLALPQTVWALKYTYDVYPGQNSVISSMTQPVLQLVLKPNEAVNLSEYRIWLDGVEYTPQYDSATGKVTVKLNTPLPVGFHSAVFQYAFEGYMSHRLTSQFEVKPAFDPYKLLPKQFYETQAELAIREVNQVRQGMGLSLYQWNSSLMAAAQAHANYIEDKANPNSISEAVHHETPGLPGYTGKNSTERATFFGYNGSTAEGIDPGGASVPALGVVRLLDSPYHRLSIIDPNYSHIGVGISGNRLQNLVLNYGTTETLDKVQLTVYPYVNQQEVPLAWQAYEVPFPLRFFNVPAGAIVGYPISVHVSSQDVQELRTLQAHLYDIGGQEISCYQVDSKLDDHGKNHLFLIPAQPLQPNQEYIADVQVEKVLSNGQIVPEQMKWNFHTAAQLRLRFVSLELGTNKSELLHVQTNLGDWPDIEFELTLNGQKMQTMSDQKYQTYGNKTLPSGIYDLHIASSQLRQQTNVKLKVWEDIYGFKQLQVVL